MEISLHCQSKLWCIFIGHWFLTLEHCRVILSHDCGGDGIANCNASVLGARRFE